jgi:hypothetical protein
MAEAKGERRFTLTPEQRARVVERLLEACREPGLVWSEEAFRALCRVYEALFGGGAGQVIRDVVGGDDRHRATWDRLLRDVDLQ